MRCSFWFNAILLTINLNQSSVFTVPGSLDKKGGRRWHLLLNKRWNLLPPFFVQRTQHSLILYGKRLLFLLHWFLILPSNVFTAKLCNWFLSCQHGCFGNVKQSTQLANLLDLHCDKCSANNSPGILDKL
jgi:hypothetical protein